MIRILMFILLCVMIIHILADPVSFGGSIGKVIHSFKTEFNKP